MTTEAARGFNAKDRARNAMSRRGFPDLFYFLPHKHRACAPILLFLYYFTTRIILASKNTL